MNAGRRCGDCQLCCRLLPTEEIAKPALARCRHQKHGTGCAIYADRPLSCRLWSCRWLVDPGLGDLPRPDRSHYVVDPMPDFVTVVPHDGSPPAHVEVVQVWVDPAHRRAHRAPAFRRWLERQGKPALIRYSPTDGFVLAPPSMTGGRGWVEETSSFGEREHSLEEKAAALGGSVEIDLCPDGAAYHTTLKIGDRAIELAALSSDDAETAREMLANARRLRDERKAGAGR